MKERDSIKSTIPKTEISESNVSMEEASEAFDVSGRVLEPEVVDEPVTPRRTQIIECRGVVVADDEDHIPAHIPAHIPSQSSGHDGEETEGVDIVDGAASLDDLSVNVLPGIGLEIPEEDVQEDSERDLVELDGLSEGGHLANVLGEHYTASASEGALVKYDPLQSYLNEIRHLPRLTREEEYNLAIRYRDHNDERAGYKLVVANLRLVVSIAREYRRNLKNILDLIQEGNLGLLQAVQQFDPLKGVRFPSYAAYWIRAYMLRYLINNIRLVKVGTTQNQRKLFFNLQKEKAKLEAEGFHPEAKLLAERLQVKESEVLEMEQRLALPDLSVDSPLNSSEDNGADYHSVLPGDHENAEEQLSNMETSYNVREAVGKFIEKLNEKEKAIVYRRLFTDEPETLQEVADTYGLSRERIRQIEARLKGQLKEYLKSELELRDDGEALF